MRALYDSKSKTIDDRGMRALFTFEAKVQSWLDIEAALALAQSEVGIIPKEAGKKIAEKCKVDCIDLQEMERLLQQIGHGFVPVIKVLINACDPESGKYVHYGVTTQNIQQSGHLLIVKKFHHILMGFLKDILQNLSQLAITHKETVMPGRTHGKHALPITYGYKVAVWIDEILSAIERLEEAEKRVFRIMMGGAVGAFHATGEQGREVQSLVAAKLGMPAMNIPSRNSRIFRAEYISNLCLLATTFHKIAEEVYQTSSEEFAEVSEAFSQGTVGSSTMPQKINPKLAKGIIANSQKLYSVLTAALYVAPRPFEADSSAYFIFDASLQESIELMAEIILRAEELTRTLVVNKQSMYRNVMLTHGLINSEKIMMSLIERLGKDQAHELVYEIAMESQNLQKDYSAALQANTTIQSIFSAQEILAMLAPENYLGLCAVLATETAERAKHKIQLMEE
ncbi:class-II fumarase/aspartase family protein [Testudinibacter sp. TR-2022]|uniref:class-II fumarase/aspartase family protein n=1 Tax=Testudinibacter sp. TR-2022 TaxID=2585029 RepID=UPI0011180C02|nr:adenylosuccinate lyase family protein [Testudinibacter sp. TR-2022]TNH05299.1 adenylosuccinate lyase family protein [Pasteurellaceae bacterium Phil11]TNH22250.1 adenylosuccinate lyase family protein [Testudinibacter sp. TR-2022]TNH25235.1 adenylosuccinate lyase family protein [Testudinibacter sp. TR-2022]